MKKILATLLVATVSIVLLIGCKKNNTNTDIPFSDFGWDATQEEIETKCGEYDEIYDGIYGGKSLVYSKEYIGLSGQVIYMFNTDGKLADIAWRTTNESDEVLTAALTKVSKDLTEKYGDKVFDNTAETALGGKWEYDNIHVLVNKVDIGNAYILQIAYLNQDTAKLGYINDTQDK